MNFKNIDGDLSVTIDNATDSLQMKELIKEDTFFTLNKSLDTPLYSSIKVDLLLYRNSVQEESAEDTDEVQNSENIETEPTAYNVVETGYVKLKILNLNRTQVYDEQTINFYDGIIQTEMINTLSLGHYILEAYYDGNKYYNPAPIYSIQFSIKKREITCIFDSDYSTGYPGQKINIGATIKDTLSNEPISNCQVTYNFNDIDYFTQTNSAGYTVFNIEIPEVDKYQCFEQPEEPIINTLNDEQHYYIDSDGNIQWLDEETFINDDELGSVLTLDDAEDTEGEIEISIVDDYDDNIPDIPYTDVTANIYNYKLNVSVDSNIYYNSEEISIIVQMQKINTDINFYAVPDNYGNIHIEGDVIGYYDDVNTGVTYGYVNPSISNIPNVQKYEVNDFGHFDFDVEVPIPNDSNITPTTFTQYSAHFPTTTNLKILNDIMPKNATLNILLSLRSLLFLSAD